MADLDRGKQIFQGLVEYPLPKKQGVQDYVFYLVPASQGYGKQARAFFDKFYPTYTKNDAGTLEDLISTLAADVTAHGIQQIRELVIVSHGNSMALLFRIFNDTSLKEYKYVTDYALALLQKDLLGGKFTDFANKRKIVVAHLLNDSRVTIRACNFGNSHKGMYALYSFFGGKANVYAPTLFQLFGTLRIIAGSRLSTRLQVHNHLIKQHYLPKDTYTPERRDAVLDSILDPAEFSEPLQLTSTHTDAPTAEATALVQALNAHSMNDFLKSKIQSQWNVTFVKPTIKVIIKDYQWLIIDTISLKDAIAQEPKTFEIHYKVNREDGISSNNYETATYSAQAQIIDAATAAKFPLQLFLSQEEHDAFNGILCTLAFYLDGSSGDPQDKTKYDSTLASLNSATSTASPLRADLATALNANADFLRNNENVQISSAATIVQPLTGPGPFTSWAIADTGQQYLIKQEDRPSDRSVTAHTIVVYGNPDPHALAARQDALVSRFGKDPDTPGTELATYLDGFSIDDLASLVDYLRSPFKPGMSFYINHAEEALMRKQGFRAWSVQHMPKATDLLIDQPTYEDLSISEWRDKQTVAYDFDIDHSWSEVKASAPTTTVIQSDLYLEEDLAKQLKIQDSDIAARLVPDDEQADSPSTDADVLGLLDKSSNQRFVSSSKSLFHVPDTSSDVGCEDFAAAIAAWNGAQDLEPQALKDLMESHKTSSGGSFLDIILDLGSKYSFLRSMGKMTELMDLPSIPTSKYSAFKELAKRGVKWAIKREEKQVVASGAEFFVTRLGVLEGMLGVLWVLPAIDIPFKMWMQVLDQQVQTDQEWGNTGKLTAIRQWLRSLEDLTWQKEDSFPDTVDINVSTPVSAEPYYIGRFYQEQIDGFGYYVPGVFAPDKLQEGFDSGVTIMAKVGPEILSAAATEATDLIRASDVDSCKISVLTRAGMLDMQKLKALIVREFAEALLEKLPKVHP